MSNFPIGTPVTQLITQTGNPNATQNPDGSSATALTDRHGALLVRQLGGQRFAAASRGNVFYSGSAVAGTTIPVYPTAANSLASKGGIVNPAGSGRNMELIAVSVANITNVIGAVLPLYLGLQLNPSGNGLALTAVTKNAAAVASPLGGSGGGVPVGYAYSAATAHFTSTTPVNDAAWYPWGNLETAVGTAPGTAYFDGEIVMGPDSHIMLLCAQAQTSVLVTWVWSEWTI